MTKETLTMPTMFLDQCKRVANLLTWLLKNLTG